MRPTTSSARRRARRGERRRELAALVCVALAVFLVFVLYLGWHGGTLGHWLVQGLRLAVGLLAFLAPFVLGYAAALFAVRRDRRPSGEVTAGVAVLCLACVLAAAADTFGLFGGARPGRTFVTSYMEGHGGVLGEALWALLHVVIGGVGIAVLVVVATVAGLLLVTGSSLGLWASRSRRGVAAAGEVARRSARTLGARRAAAEDLRLRERDATLATEPRPFERDEPHRVTLIDGARDLRDDYGATTAVDAAAPVFARPRPDERPVQRTEADDAGEQLSLADEAEEAGDEAGAVAFEPPVERLWRLPDPGMLQRTKAGEGEAQAVIASVAAQLTETLGHFGV